MANSDGGQILIGKDDEGNTIGLSDKELRYLLPDLPNSISQTMKLHNISLTVEEDGNGRYLVVTVPKSDHVVFYRGVMYRRIGATNLMVEGLDMQNALLGQRNASWDSQTVDGLAIDP